MPDSKRAIKIIILLIIGLWLGIPGEFELGTIILQPIARTIQPLDLQQANQLFAFGIWFLRLLGWLFILADVYIVYRWISRSD